MSKAFVRASAPVNLGSFATLLPTVEESAQVSQGRARLGKTAEGLQKLRDEAYAEGRALGFEEGYSCGREDGYQAVRSDLANSVEDFRCALDTAATKVEGAIADWYIASEQTLSELAVAIAARILARELELSTDSITSLTREAIKEIATADKVRIRVNPFDAPVLQREKALLLSATPTVRQVEIVDDPSISGGARIESDSGAIDATIRTQIELAIKAIRGRE